MVPTLVSRRFFCTSHRRRSFYSCKLDGHLTSEARPTRSPSRACVRYERNCYPAIQVRLAPLGITNGTKACKISKAVHLYQRPLLSTMVAIRVNRNRNSPPRAIVNRRYDPTPAVAATEIGTCGHCGRFLTSSGDQDDTSIFRTNVVFTDGSCLTNAQGQTYTGWGIATGTNESQQYAIPFDCSVGKRTSQRAELLGAYEGMIRGLRDMIRDCPRYGEQHTDWGNRNELVIFCDSEYVVKTMTQWLPVWKVWKTHLSLDILWFRITYFWEIRQMT